MCWSILLDCADVCTLDPSVCDDISSSSPEPEYGEWTEAVAYSDLPTGSIDPSDAPDPDDLDWEDWFYGGGGTTAPLEPPSYTILTSQDNYFKPYSTGAEFVVAAGQMIYLKCIGDSTDQAPVHPSGMHWEFNSSSQCTGTNVCSFTPSTTGTYTVTVRDGSNNKLIEVKLIVYGKSILKFREMLNYDGEYGFDDVGINFNAIKQYYMSPITIDSKNYNVPWLSLYDGQEAIVKVEPILLSTDASSSSYTMKFVPSNSNIIIKSGGVQIQNVALSASTLSSLTSIKIKCTELDPVASNHTKEYINVLNNNNEVVGKISISCQKFRSKKIVFVYVNRGNGYPAKNTSTTLQYLDSNSHNQIFLNYKLPTGTTYSDTLDISADYAAYTIIYQTQSLLVSTLLDDYIAHKSVNPRTINMQSNSSIYLDGTDTNRVNFMFITDFSPPGIIGRALDIGAPFAYAQAGFGDYVVAHELGHCINLFHTFQRTTGNPSGAYYAFIPEFETFNHMDYAKKHKYFFLYQWLYSY